MVIIPPHLSHLAPPSPEAQALSDELSTLIARKIDAAGGAKIVWVDFPKQKSAPLPDFLRALVS